MGDSVSVSVINAAGEVVSEELQSDAEACRWFLDQGRSGDYLSTGELMSEVVNDVLGISVRFDSSECVVAPREEA